MNAQFNRAHQRQIDAQCDCCPPIDPEQAEYETWCDARHETAELDAMRDFLMQHKRVTGVIARTSGLHPLMATVHTDSFAEWTAWDMRVNWRNREPQS